MGGIAHCFGRTDQVVVGDVLKRLFEIKEIFGAMSLPVRASPDLIAPRTISNPAAGTIIA
jgi:hypothetical protein